MKEKVRQRRCHNKDRRPSDPECRRYGEWSQANRGCYNAFRDWLKATGFSDSALSTYSVAARYTIGYLDRPYWMIDTEADLERVLQRICERYPSPETQASYGKGVRKFGEFLRLKCHKPLRTKKINWEYFTGPLPAWLAEDVRSFIQHCQRNWSLERRYEASRDTLSHLTQSLRWMVKHFSLADSSDITPETWFAYLDERLDKGIKPATVNSEFSQLRHFVSFLEEHGRPICARLLLVDYLDAGRTLPKDVPPEQLRLLQQEIQRESAAENGLQRQMGILDKAWFFLMLHSGLRTCEIRVLRLRDIDWENHRMRIEQSKGLKDRLVYLSPVAVAALRDYLTIRGPEGALPDYLFVFRHKPLSKSYCSCRLRTYGKRAGVQVTPHQLRHSCATLLLNAGAPILTVKMLLGHKHVDTTLGYARLYDGTVAADYFQAMNLIEKQLALPEDQVVLPPCPGELIALVDSLRTGTLNDHQQEVVWQLRAGLMSLAEQQGELVEVPPAGMI